MKEALEQKDLDLAAAQKEAREKTKLADQKLASAGKLEEENAKLKTAILNANREVEQLKKDSAYAFEDMTPPPPPFADGDGTNTLLGAEKSGVEKSFFAMNPNLKV